MKKFLVFVCIIFLIIFFALKPSLAWEGYDYEKGDYIEIEKGNLVREGKDIEIYDYSDGEYRDVEVESIEDHGSSVEIEVYDYETGEYRTFEMED